MMGKISPDPLAPCPVEPFNDCLFDIRISGDMKVDPSSVKKILKCCTYKFLTSIGLQAQG